MTELEVGEFYRPEELPTNVMESNGMPTWVSDYFVAITTDDGLSYEFRAYDRAVVDWDRINHESDDRYYHCVEKSRVTEGGGVEVLCSERGDSE